MTEDQIATCDALWASLEPSKARWMSGMLDNSGCRAIAITDDDGSVLWVDYDKERGEVGDYECGPTASPDWTDPATLGCLLALVREAWGDRNWAAYEVMADAWGAFCGEGKALQVFHGETEAEALLRALRAAP